MMTLAEPKLAAKVEDFDTTPANDDWGRWMPRVLGTRWPNHFAVGWEGRLLIEKRGEYRFVADTDDGRVQSLSGPGTMRASVHDNGLTQLDLWLSTDLQCQSEGDTLPYRSADCASVAQVTAQLGFNEYLDNTAPDGGRLELYVRERDSSAAPGAADRVDRLELTR